jgi:hypothetical protein
MIDEACYQKHKEYLAKEVNLTFDFNLFDYWVGLYSIKASEYKKDYHEVLPPHF